mmetsp:Transcript_7456/g.10103  ORF Transcript_7456/g.10103 Transcript_7456/m.10103 type:complete len:361 (+) Transcript_7456:63-1145(+)|eukprot:CAMPEP_0196579984 /NCGR_PEP_ID=MMETSP1081-20130531/26108_1 /TAXON_ID=36882 /ORGANISM="Pyramimonas amylifera, Strain CCMP720" /LENGTH=360 /DNA_ID=CAMNT_0041899725 /DNA_START=50 /DNA_END=1132 /DNA_ORIENTATION=+
MALYLNSMSCSHNINLDNQLSSRLIRVNASHRVSLRAKIPEVKCKVHDNTSESVSIIQPTLIKKSRRDVFTQAGLVFLASSCTLADQAPAYAAGKGARKKIPLDQYSALPAFQWLGAEHEGIKVVDIEEGRGRDLIKNATLVVHYDCKYRGLLAVSSREARLLGGNRTIAEPFEFTYGRVPSDYTRAIRMDTFTGVGLKVSRDNDIGLYFVDNVTKNTPGAKAGIERNDSIVSINGEEIALLTTSQVSKLLIGEAGSDVTLSIIPYGKETAKEFTLTREQYKVRAKTQVVPLEGGGGLYSGNTGPKPPAALFLALDGMKVGGKRSIIVPADIGYGDEGNNEIPGDADYFIMDVEILDMKA